MVLRGSGWGTRLVLKSGLVTTTSRKDKALGMSEVGAKKLQAELDKYKSNPVELHKIASDLLLFAHFLETELESPHAAAGIKYLVGQLPNLQRQVADAETQVRITADSLAMADPDEKNALLRRLAWPSR